MDQYPGGLVSIDWQPGRASLRSFGIALALLCIGRAAWHWTNNDQTIALSVGGAFACAALFRPSVLRGPYVLLGVLSYPLRWLLSYTVLAVVYFGVITPVAYGVRLARRLQANKIETHSHWRATPPRGDKPSYFRQF